MRAVAEPDNFPKHVTIRQTDVGADFDPIACLAEARVGDLAFYLERPDIAEVMVAIGSVAEVRTAGASRFADASAAAARLLASLRIERGSADASARSVLPRLVGGFSFADAMDSPLWRDFVPCRLVLPRTQWLFADGRWVRFDVVAMDPIDPPRAPRLTAPALLASAASSPRAEVVAAVESPSQWLSRVRAVLDVIDEGRLDKIVVARRESRALTQTVDVSGVLADLRATRPSCYTFCVATGASIFIGSSPEKLVGVRSGEVEADALAGTIGRGRTRAEDRERAGALAASEKDLREHAVVVDDLLATLAPFVYSLTSDARPSACAFPEGYHLHTPVRGRRAGHASVLDLAGAVHPTPAVCGAPRAGAQALLGRLEPDRGWYAGGVGWLDVEGEGLFAVALRAGLFADGRLTTWAGAGIIAGSDAELELEETALKMRALLDVIGERAA